MHKGIRDIPTELQKGRLLFGFVRHPLSWYQSYWVYRKIQGWSVDDVRNGHHITESFTHFVESRLHHRPCGVSIMYRTKFGSKKSDNIFIGKMENLRQNLCTALDMAGEDYGAGIINTKEKTNVASSNDEWKEKCYYTPELLEKVLETEEEAINRFGYSNTDL